MTPRRAQKSTEEHRRAMQGLQGLVRRQSIFKYMSKRSIDVPNLIWQMVGYAFTFVIHVSNIVFLGVMKEHESSTVSNDPTIKFYRERVCMYFTCWTVCIQIIYSITGFICTSVLFLNYLNKKYWLPEEIRNTREVMFAGVVWPCSMVMSTVFWSLYFYDRSLIHPEILDEVIGPASNHILHTLIVPIVVWEAVFRKREKPISHYRNLRQMIIHVIAYSSFIYYTFLTEGIWLHPIFEKTYGTIDFITLHLALAALFFMFYYLQWVLNDLVHGNKEKRKLK